MPAVADTRWRHEQTSGQGYPGSRAQLSMSSHTSCWVWTSGNRHRQDEGTKIEVRTRTTTPWQRARLRMRMTLQRQSQSFALMPASGNRDELCETSNLVVDGLTCVLVMDVTNRSGVSVEFFFFTTTTMKESSHHDAQSTPDHAQTSQAEKALPRHTAPKTHAQEDPPRKLRRTWHRRRSSSWSIAFPTRELPRET